MDDSLANKLEHYSTLVNESDEVGNFTFVEYTQYPLSQRIPISILLSLILLVGVLGNIGLIVIVHVSRSLHRPTYCYLTSLAVADLVVLISTIPEALVEYQIGTKWIFGQIGCSGMVFSNFLGINAGSLSLLAFTMERYTAVLRPMLARKVCNTQRANKIIVVVWIMSISYCTPWLFLTIIRPASNDPTVFICGFRLLQHQYLTIFGIDLILFYIIPLLFAAIVYWQVFKLKSIPRKAGADSLNRSSLAMRSSSHHGVNSVFHENEDSMISCNGTRHQRLHILLVVVIVFAVCWLPYRGVLVYNSLASVPWWDTMYMLFAKTLIYVNSAINPLLYSFIDQSLRKAVKKAFTKLKRSESHL